MNYIENLERIIDYCENNLSYEISLDELATEAGYSVFYFCRLFQSVTGCSPKEYMRKRRLSQAAMDLYDSNAYVKDVGYKWGFNSHENFVRAFKKQFGVSPSLYREVKSSLNLFHKNERINTPYCEDLRLTPRFVEKPSFKVAGFTCHAIWENNANEMPVPKHWNTYHACRLYEKIGKKIDPSCRYDIGMVIENDVNNDTFSYLIGIEVGDTDEISKDCVKITIPSAHYAVFNTPPTDTSSFVRNIHKTWQYIYQVWLPQSGFKHSGAHEFETYCEASYAFSEEIWIPLAK